MTKELKPDDLAFVNAYGHAVASVPREYVIEFLTTPEDKMDELCDNMADFTSVADAYELWQIALHYAKGKA
jgi:hypothetical protein